mmetsp:Transcript_81651/g.249408  ORF Transcript_81651/g.249408 Transcript_81651/m.249408 type:complete len:245 (-) Transcript_81651:845-1579(-)
MRCSAVKGSHPILRNSNEVTAVRPGSSFSSLSAASPCKLLTSCCDRARRKPRTLLCDIWSMSSLILAFSAIPSIMSAYGFEKTSVYAPSRNCSTRHSQRHMKSRKPSFISRQMLSVGPRMFRNVVKRSINMAVNMFIRRNTMVKRNRKSHTIAEYGKVSYIRSKSNVPSSIWTVVLAAFATVDHSSNWGPNNTWPPVTKLMKHTPNTIWKWKTKWKDPVTANWIMHNFSCPTQPFKKRAVMTVA